jgi:hypothetical protein
MGAPPVELETERLVIPMDPAALATWVLAGVTLLSAGFVVWQLIDSTRVREAQTTFLRRQETLRLYSTTRDSRQIAKIGLPRDSDEDAVAAFIETAKKDEAHRLAVRDYLNYWEEIATGVRFGVLDAEMLRALVGPRLASIFRNYRPHIDWIRENHSPGTFMVEVEGLVKDWTRD